MAISIKTGRGAYALRAASPPERTEHATTVTIALERADGIERVMLKCRIDDDLLALETARSADAIVARLAPWIEREFEQVRDAALKAIRTEHRLNEIIFDTSTRGPF
ncbi:MAG TPA: hypothetical protein VEC38_12460 [Candidatus Binataceae bacterium]|nr:hypothetical protein [Candidatus Binataceae bacterium]